MAELKGGSTVGGYTIWHRGNFDPASFLSSGGNAATATKLQTARTINGVAFDGTANITIADSTKLPLTGGTLTGAVTFANGTWNTVGDDAQFGDVNQGGIIGVRSNNVATHVGLGFYMQGAATTAPTALLKVLSTGVADLNVPLNCSQVNGNASTATKLQTARTLAISGDATGSASFDGSANTTIEVTLANKGTANGIATLDSTGKVPSSQLPLMGQYIGAQAVKAISYNAQTIDENVTIPGTVNAMSAGPITISTGYTVTISDGATWTIV